MLKSIKAEPVTAVFNEPLRWEWLTNKPKEHVAKVDVIGSPYGGFQVILRRLATADILTPSQAQKAGYDEDTLWFVQVDTADNRTLQILTGNGKDTDRVSGTLQDIVRNHRANWNKSVAYLFAAARADQNQLHWVTDLADNVDDEFRWNNEAFQIRSPVGFTSRYLESGVRGFLIYPNR